MILWLHPSQFAAFKAAGYDMRYYRVIKPIPSSVGTVPVVRTKKLRDR